jgi:protoporphyrinogen oxidase
VNLRKKEKILMKRKKKERKKERKKKERKKEIYQLDPIARGMKMFINKTLHFP